MICLQNICLGLIAGEFEIFHHAFSRSNNETLKRSLEFLQIKYSSELFSELFQRRKLKNEYLNFLLNTHLQFLDERWIYWNPSYQCSKEYVFSRLPNLTKIFCNDVDDEILKNLAQFCPKIVEIDSCSSSATELGVNYLCKKRNGNIPCPELKKLFINSPWVTDNGVKMLIRDLKYLEKLDHQNVPLVIYSMLKKRLPKLESVPSYNLVELMLYDELEELNLLPYYNDLLKICLTVCPKLKALSCAISDKSQLDFFNSTSLQDLSITFTNQKIDVDNFLKIYGFKLISLNVTNCIMSVSELSVNCPKLERLMIDDVTLSCDHGDSEVVFHSLVAFTFSQRENKIVNEKEFALILSSSPSLEELSFTDCDLSPSMKTNILTACEKHMLKSIFFMECTNVDKNFFKDVLLSCPSLKALKTRIFPVSEQNELEQFAETLPNKPRIGIF